MIDLISPMILVGAAVPVLGLHAYSAKKKKVLVRFSAIGSLTAIAGFTLWIWSIEHDGRPEHANGLAAAFFLWFAIAGIVGLQLIFLVIDQLTGTRKSQSYWKQRSLPR